MEPKSVASQLHHDSYFSKIIFKIIFPSTPMSIK
jgi:hypothetical protein